jgi:hypothetical protein
MKDIEFKELEELEESEESALLLNQARLWALYNISVYFPNVSSQVHRRSIPPNTADKLWSARVQL